MSNTKPWEHIKDAYLRDKLEKGLIKYEPHVWEENDLISEHDEQELRRAGVK